MPATRSPRTGATSRPLPAFWRGAISRRAAPGSAFVATGAGHCSPTCARAATTIPVHLRAEAWCLRCSTMRRHLRGARGRMRDAGRYNGFNLLAGTVGDASWVSNRGRAAHVAGRRPRPVERTARHTVAEARAHAGRACRLGRARRRDLSPLFAALADRTQATGRCVAGDRRAARMGAAAVGAVHRQRRYGTRCSTVLAVARTGDARFVERTFDAQGAPAAKWRSISKSRANWPSERAPSPALAPSCGAECPPPGIRRRNREPMARIEGHRVRLRVEHHARVAKRARKFHQRHEQRRPDTAVPPGGRDRQASDVAVGQQPPAADRAPSRVDGQRMTRDSVDVVPFEVFGNALFDDEDRPPHLAHCAARSRPVDEADRERVSLRVSVHSSTA